VLATAACGRKGPPLPPIVYLPAPVGDYSVKRQGDEVVLQFKIPTANTDSSSPADLQRVEVYAHTGPLPAAMDFVRYGTLVKSVDVKPADPPTAAASTASVTTAGVAQGETVRVSEVLTDALKEPGPLPPSRLAPLRNAPVVETLETPGTENFEPIAVRYYAVVGVSESRGRRGPFLGPTAVAFTAAQDPPAGVQVTYTEDAITLTWPALPGDSRIDAVPEPTVLLLETAGTVNQVAETEGTVELAPRAPAIPADAAVKPAPPPAAISPRFGYNVYEVPTNQDEQPPPPLNAALLTVPSYTDSRIAFGVERCYVVRRVEVAGGLHIESVATPPSCLTPEDTFPPAAPQSLASVSADGVVDLIWNANAEADLAGYLILRGDAPGEKLARLTPAPITETTYRDTAVEPGRTYVYAVAAVDKAARPNVSGYSNEVTQVVR
jgi:hypothetical protein